MTEATLTADINIIKSQLETEIVKYQSEIYLRQAKIHALDVFGNSNTVQNWLEEKNPALNGATPAELLDSFAGLERVLDLIDITRTKLEQLRQRIDLMKQTEIDPESEADFQTFMEIFDAQRSIDRQLFNRQRSNNCDN
jgi:signal transduction protein with GAF and PtsI domain